MDTATNVFGAGLVWGRVSLGHLSQKSAFARGIFRSLELQSIHWINMFHNGKHRQCSLHSPVHLDDCTVPKNATFATDKSYDRKRTESKCVEEVQDEPAQAAARKSKGCREMRSVGQAAATWASLCFAAAHSHSVSVPTPGFCTLLLIALSSTTNLGYRIPGTPFLMEHALPGTISNLSHAALLNEGKIWAVQVKQPK